MGAVRGPWIVVGVVAGAVACHASGPDAGAARTVSLAQPDVSAEQGFVLAPDERRPRSIRGRCCVVEASGAVEVRVVVRDPMAGGDPARHAPVTRLDAATRCAETPFLCEVADCEGVDVRCSLLTREGAGPVTLELSAVEDVAVGHGREVQWWLRLDGAVVERPAER